MKDNQIELKKIHYPSINGLRGISILLVIIHHLNERDHIFKMFKDIKILEPFISFLEDGHLGVNVFFVISGFLITSLLLIEESSSKKISLKNFFIRRTIRIFPAYYFLLLVYFILQFLNIINISKSSWITSLTYTKYFNWQLDWFTSHAWSLSIEEHFYILWPLLFMLGKKQRKFTALLIVFLVPIIRFYTYYNPISWVNDLTIFTRVDSIVIGCLFALYKDRILALVSLKWKMVFWVSLISLFLLRYFPVFSDYVFLGSSIIYKGLGLTHGTIANLLIALIMMYAVFGPQKTFYKLLNSHFFNYLGIISYSLYLWQQLFISRIDNWIFIFPQNLVFIFGMGIFSYYIIEKPFLKFKNRFKSKNC